MKVVIDIPDEIYEVVRECEEHSERYCMDVTGGTPLPEGCDLIDRQTAVNAIKELCKHYTPEKAVMHPHIDFVIDELMKLPAVFKSEELEDW